MAAVPKGIIVQTVITIFCDQNIPADTCWLLAQDIAATINKDVDLIDLWQAATVLRKEV